MGLLLLSTSFVIGDETKARRLVFSHHKTGHVLAHRLAARTQERRKASKAQDGDPALESAGHAVHHGGTWWGQGLAKWSAGHSVNIALFKTPDHTVLPEP